jgi:hypothetical protein
MSNTSATSVKKCRDRAYAYLTDLIGAHPEALTWDSTHRLQGHVHVGRRELVVIATRDDSHAPVVMTAPSWDAVRHCQADQRRELLGSCAITDRIGLVSVLEADDLAA